MLRVVDPPSRFSSRIEERIASNRAELSKTKVDGEFDVDLMASDEEIAGTYLSVMGRPGQATTLVLDITTLPKRFFFLMLKLGLKERRIQSVFVTYTQPRLGGYTPETLAENPEAVASIPGYGTTGRDPEMLVVGLGFEPLGLRQLINEYRYSQRTIEVLMAFPPGQPYSRRIWDALQKLGFGNGYKRIHRVNALDAFASYAMIEELTHVSGRRKPPALAPYGPKPMSLGMCLYALRHGAPVLYTQPMVYHPDYSMGTGDCWGYCLKYEGRQFF